MYCFHFRSHGKSGAILFDKENSRFGVYVNGILDGTFSSADTPPDAEGLPYNLPINL